MRGSESYASVAGMPESPAEGDDEGRPLKLADRGMLPETGELGGLSKVDARGSSKKSYLGAVDDGPPKVEDDGTPK